MKTLKIAELPTEQRKVFLEIIRQFAIDSGAARERGIEGAEEAILREIEANRVKVFYDRETKILTLEVIRGE